MRPVNLIIFVISYELTVWFCTIKDLTGEEKLLIRQIKTEPKEEAAIVTNFQQENSGMTIIN